MRQKRRRVVRLFSGALPLAGAILLCVAAAASGAQPGTTKADIAKTTSVDGVERKLIDVTAADYGADPTGVRDSAPAFRAAMMHPDAKIVVPAGTYKFASTVKAPCCKAVNPTAVPVANLANFEIDGYGATIVIDPSISLSSAFFFFNSKDFAVRGLTVQGANHAEKAENSGFALQSDVNFRLSDLHITGNFGGQGTGIAGDWLVNGKFENIRMDAVGQCLDLAFLKDVTIQGIRARGAAWDGRSVGPGKVGSKCVSVISDGPNADANATGVKFDETYGVTINNVSATNFNVGAFLTTGKRYRLTGNHWYGNPGIAEKGVAGVGVMIRYNDSGLFSSVGHPPGDIVISRDTFSDNGLEHTTLASDVMISANTITNSDMIRGIMIENSNFTNRNPKANAAIETNARDRIANVILYSNRFSGANRTAVGRNLAPIASSAASPHTSGSRGRLDVPQDP
jgi:hypothetical protein